MPTTPPARPVPNGRPLLTIELNLRAGDQTKPTPYDAAVAAMMIVPLEHQAFAWEHWRKRYTSLRRLTDPLDLFDLAYWHLKEDPDWRGTSAFAVLVGPSKALGEMVDRLHDLAEQLADELFLTGQPDRPKAGPLTAEAAKAEARRMKTWARDHSAVSSTAPSAPTSPAVTISPVTVRLIPSEKDYVDQLRKAGRRLKGSVLAYRTHNKHDGHERGIMASLVRRGVLTHRKDGPDPGYGLPGWP